MAMRKNSASKGKKAAAETRKKLKVGDIRGQKSASMKEVALNIGSQSSGAGAGKVTFNPF